MKLSYAKFSKCRPDRFYLNGMSGKVYLVSNKDMGLDVVAENADDSAQLTNWLNELGYNSSSVVTPSEVETVARMICQRFSFERPDLVWKSPEQLHSESLSLDPATIKFKASTLRDTTVFVDHREPKEIAAILTKTKLKVETTTLPEGDFRILCGKSHRQLVIERKRIDDLSQSIRGDAHHAHDQVETYYDLMRSSAAIGIEVKVVWILECYDQGKMTPYHALPEIKHMDGWVNYSLMISDQPSVWSFSPNHTAYLITKFVQGFIERELTYKVKVGDKRIDRKHEPLMAQSAPRSGGVSRAKDGLAGQLAALPGIPTNVARELAKTGKSFSEIVSMDIASLSQVKGVGSKRAAAIFATFNRDS